MNPETQKRITAERVADTCNRIEGVPIFKYTQELSMQWVHGQITSDEMIFSLVEHYKKNI